MSAYESKSFNIYEVTLIGFDAEVVSVLFSEVPLSASFTLISSIPSITLRHTGHLFVCDANIFAQSRHIHKCLTV